MIKILKLLKVCDVKANNYLTMLITYMEKVFFPGIVAGCYPNNVFSSITFGNSAASVAGDFLWNTAYCPALGT